MEEKPKLRYFDVVPHVRGFIIRDPLLISKEMFLSRESFLLLSLIDGNNTIRDIKMKFLKMTGILLSDIEIINFIEELDKNFLLFSRRFLGKIEEEKKKMRESNFKEIKTNYDIFDIERIFKEKSKDSKENIKGMIIPHIDINVAFDTYLKVFSYLKNMKERIIFIFGVPHFWYEVPFSIFPKNFKVKDRIIESDIDLIEKINSKFEYDIKGDFFSYKNEHSIDFPIIFLSFLEEKKKVIASLVSENKKENLIKIKEKICEGLKDIKKEDMFFISSVDLSHVGKKFGDEKSYDTEDVDKTYLTYLSDLENEKAFDFLEESRNKTRIDGKNTNFLFLEILKEFGIKKGEIIDYKNYYEELTDSSVTYSFLIFK